jgi:hypothetical protein
MILNIVFLKADERNMWEGLYSKNGLAAKNIALEILEIETVHRIRPSQIFVKHLA